MKKLLKIALLLLVIIFFSCQKDDYQYLEKEAIIKWKGAYEVDGCGFFIVVDNKEYKPENENKIDAKYKSGETAVLLTYRDLNISRRVMCFRNPERSEMPLLSVISIRDK
jgi:hypothetical protein